MTEPTKNDNNDKGMEADNQSTENLFKIMDGIIHELNKTKKMFIIMIVTIMIIPPLSFAITFTLLAQEEQQQSQPQPSPSSSSHGFEREHNHFFRLARFIPVIISVVWLGVGIRQWFVLSKWTKKYERYKQLQKRIDEELD